MREGLGEHLTSFARVRAQHAYQGGKNNEVMKIAGIFKAYDIRGIVDKELNEELAYKIGRAFVITTETARKQLLVGRDMRTSSIPYAKALMQGITDAGADVVDAGLVSTPLFYFATKTYAAGIMVTASHNPKEYNGFKFCKEEAIPISYETGIKEIERLISESPESGCQDETEQGTLEECDFLQAFLDFNLAFLKTTKQFTIVVDAGNGMGGLTYEAMLPLLKERNITIIPLYFDPDGSFPNHEANPLKEETLDALKEKMKEVDADFGLSLDGDGDRCVFIDENQETIPADLFLALIAQELLKDHPGGIILHDLRASRAVREAIIAAGGKPRMSRVGHAYIKAQMRDEGAILAGEVSGHFYPGLANYTENTFYALFHLLNLLEETGKSLSELVAPLQKYAYSGELNNKVADADAVLAAVNEKYDSDKTAIDISHIDGIRVEYKTWWFNVRKSNTEPLVRLIVEADTLEEMKEKRDELLAIINDEEK